MQPTIIDQTMLCAAGAAYNIVGTTYEPDSFFDPQLHWTQQPTVFVGGAENIDACLVGQNAQGIIVSARGTLFSGTGYLDDWLNDFWEEPTAWGYPLTSGIVFPGKVHSGFWNAVVNVYPGVRQTVQTLLSASSSGTKVYVTGHSKGGGMAPLLAYLLHLDSIPVAQVVTFAAPKPGNTGFQQLYAKTFSTNHTRYENYGDLVPLLWPAAGDVNPFLAELASYLKTWAKDWPIFGTLATDITAAQQWDYQPVGTEAYIGWDFATETQKIYTDPVYIADNQGVDLLANIAWQTAENGYTPEQLLLLAHTIAGCVTFSSTPVVGYLRAVCPDLQPPVCPAPTANALPRHA